MICPLCGRLTDGGYALDSIGFPTCMRCILGSEGWPAGNPFSQLLTSPTDGLYGSDTTLGIRIRQLRSLATHCHSPYGTIIGLPNICASIASFLTPLSYGVTPPLPTEWVRGAE